jgi:hypothetical protein
MKRAFLVGFLSLAIAPTILFAQTYDVGALTAAIRGMRDG